MSQRIPLRQLLAAGFADGQVPGYDAVNGLLVPSDVVRGLTSADASVSIVDNGDGTYDLAATGGGGGGSAANLVLLEDGASAPPSGTASGTILFRKGPPKTYDFTAGALPAGWSKHGAPTETFDGTGMTCTFAAGQGYHVATVPSGDFTVEMSMVSLSSTGTMFGPMITNTSGTGQGAAWYNAPAALLGISVSAWSYASSFTNNGGTFAVPNRIRLRRVGTYYYASYSFDSGVTYSAESSYRTDVSIPGYIAIGSAYGSGTVKVSKVIVTPSGGGKAIGWWDGSAIQPLA